MARVQKVRPFGDGGRLSVTVEELRVLGWGVGEEVCGYVEGGPNRSRLVFERARPQESRARARGRRAARRPKRLPTWEEALVKFRDQIDQVRERPPANHDPPIDITTFRPLPPEVAARLTPLQRAISDMFEQALRELAAEDTLEGAYVRKVLPEYAPAKNRSG